MGKYVKTVWKNEPSTETPITAERLNNIEDGIENVDNGLEETDTRLGKVEERLTKRQPANTVLAAPNGGAGEAEFRKLAEEDLPEHTHDKLKNDNGSLLYTYSNGRNSLYSTGKDNIGTYDSPLNCVYTDDVYLTSIGSAKENLLKKSDISNNFTTEDWHQVAAAPLVKYLREDVDFNEKMMMKPVHIVQRVLNKLVSQEDVGVKWGKVALAVEKLIAHLNNEDTPHGLEPYSEVEVTDDINGSTTVEKEGIKYGGTWLMKKPYNKVKTDYVESSHCDAQFVDASTYVRCSNTDGASMMLPGEIITKNISQGRKNGSEAGDYSMTQGSECTADGMGSFAGGNYSEASGYNSFAFGKEVKAKYDNQFSVGKYNSNNSKNVFEVGAGDNDKARDNAFEVDKDGNAIAKESVISPTGTFDSVATKEVVLNGKNVEESFNAINRNVGYSTARKANSDAGVSSTVFGMGNTASGDYSMAIGNGTTASGQQSFSAGLGTTASGTSQFVIGRYNKQDTSKAFIIGGGSNADSTKNLMEVSWTGGVDFSGSIKAANFNGLASNFTTEDWKMGAAAPLVKQLYEENQTLKEQISTLNSNIGSFRYVQQPLLPIGESKITLNKGCYLLFAWQTGAWDLNAVAYLTVSGYAGGTKYYFIAGSDAIKTLLTVTVTPHGEVTFNNQTGCQFRVWIYNVI